MWLSWVRIGNAEPDPNSAAWKFESRIPEPKTKTEERSEKKFVIIPFNVATNFTKLKIILVSKCGRKKFEPISKNYRAFYPKKLPLSSQRYGFGIRDPEKTYSGSRIRVQGSKRHRIPDPDQQHCLRDSSLVIIPAKKNR
jgi:hypothetical protein